MAADQPELDPIRLTAGAEMLRLTDGVGFDAHSAAWVLDRETATWRYVLSSPMLGSQGPEWVYARLLRAFAKLQLPPGISPLDVFVIDPSIEAAVLGNPNSLAVGGTPPGIETRITIRDADLGAFSVGFGLMVFYRRRPLQDRGRDPSRTFDLRVRKLAA